MSDIDLSRVPGYSEGLVAAQDYVQERYDSWWESDVARDALETAVPIILRAVIDGWPGASWNGEWLGDFVTRWLGHRRASNIGIYPLCTCGYQWLTHADRCASGVSE